MNISRRPVFLCSAPSCSRLSAHSLRLVSIIPQMVRPFRGTAIVEVYEERPSPLNCGAITKFLTAIIAPLARRTVESLVMFAQ